MEPALLFIGSQYDITCVFMIKNDLYSGDTNGYVIKWDFESRRSDLKWKAHNKHLLSIEYLNSKHQVITHGRDGFIKFWMRADNKFVEVNRTESNQFSFCRMALYHADFNEVELICNTLDDEDHTLEIIEYPKDVITHNLYSKPSVDLPITNYGMVMCVCILDMELLLVAYESGYVVMFKKFRFNSSIKVSDCIICMAINKERLIIVGTPESELNAFKIDDECNKIIEIKKIALKNAGISSIVFRQDGKIFATAGWDGLIRVFSSKSFKQLVVLKWNIDYGNNEKSNHLALAFNNENYLISGSNDKIICFWDVFRK